MPTATELETSAYERKVVGPFSDHYFLVFRDTTPKRGPPASPEWLNTDGLPCEQLCGPCGGISQIVVLDPAPYSYTAGPRLVLAAYPNTEDPSAIESNFEDEFIPGEGLAIAVQNQVDGPPRSSKTFRSRYNSYHIRHSGWRVPADQIR